MKVQVLMAIAILVTATALAQEPAPARVEPVDPVVGTTRPSSAAEPAASSTSQGTSSSSQAATVQQPAPPPSPPRDDDRRPRRRGSMVGYIEDPVVSSKLRIRFDAGLHNDAPDRAEFFYAKCGCYRDLPSNDPAFDASAPGPRPGAADVLNYQQLYLEGEYAVHDRVSFFAELPVRWIQPQSFIPGTGGSFPNHSGLADLRAGVRFALLDTERQLVTVQVRSYVPTGKASDGLGTDHWSLEPTLLLYQQVNDRCAVEGQIGDWHPFGGAAGIPTSGSDKFSGDVFFYGIGPSFELYRSDRVRFAPVIELVGWRTLGGFQTGSPADASGTNVVNLKFGARTSWNGHGSFYVGYGHAVTKASWYDNIVRFEYRHSF